MVSNPNFYGQSTTGTPNQIEDGVDFPHTGIIKALADGLGQNYGISGFDITTDSATQIDVGAGVIIRDGKREAIDAVSNLTLSLTSSGNNYHLVVVDKDDNIVIRSPSAADKVAEYTVRTSSEAQGDTIIAVVTHNGNDPMPIQYLTVDKAENSLSVGYSNSGTYTEAGSLTGDSNGITMTGLYKLDTLPTATVDSAQSKILIQDGDNTDEIRTVTAGDVGDLGKQDLQGVSNEGATTTTSLTAASFIKTGGTSSQFLKADGSSDSSTYLTTESDTLHSVTGRGTGTTTNAIGIGGLTNDGHLLSSTLDGALAGTDLASASKTANIYYINGTVSLGNALNNQIIQIKNTHTASVNINSTSPFDGGSGSLTDQRVVGPNTVVLESNEAITCQFRTDGLFPQGWYILDTDVDTDTDTGILNVVEDTTPQLGGDLDVNGNSIVSTSNGDITIAPHGTGVLTVSNNIEITDDKYIKWGTDSYIQSGQSGADLTVLATDDLFLRATDAIGLRNGSNYTMWLTSTNRVGIGTTTPANMLHLSDADANEPTILIENTGTSTSEPNLMFRRSGSHPSDPTIDIGRIGFEGDNTADENILYAAIVGDAHVATDGDERGRMRFYVMRAGALTEILRIGGYEAVINEGGGDVNFRVEGETDSNLLFVDAGNDKVGISTSSPVADFDVDSGKSFRSTRLLTVALSSNTTLTEAAHAGRYVFVTGSSTTITLPANQAAGVHFTLLSNDANGFTLTSTDNMNGSSSDITVDARNGVTCISDGSNYVVLGA